MPQILITGFVYRLAKSLQLNLCKPKGEMIEKDKPNIINYEKQSIE